MSGLSSTINNNGSLSMGAFSSSSESEPEKVASIDMSSDIESGCGVLLSYDLGIGQLQRKTQTKSSTLTNLTFYFYRSIKQFYQCFYQSQTYTR